MIAIYKETLVMVFLFVYFLGFITPLVFCWWHDRQIKKRHYNKPIKPDLQDKHRPIRFGRL